MTLPVRNNTESVNNQADTSNKISGTFLGRTYTRKTQPGDFIGDVIYTLVAFILAIGCVTSGTFALGAYSAGAKPALAFAFSAVLAAGSYCSYHWRFFQ